MSEKVWERRRAKAKDWTRNGKYLMVPPAVSFILWAQMRNVDRFVCLPYKFSLQVWGWQVVRPIIAWGEERRRGRVADGQPCGPTRGKEGQERPKEERIWWWLVQFLFNTTYKSLLDQHSFIDMKGSEGREDWIQGRPCYSAHIIERVLGETRCPLPCSPGPAQLSVTCSTFFCLYVGRAWDWG